MCDFKTVLFNFTVLNIFVSCLDILVSKVFRVKPTFSGLKLGGRTVARGD